MRIRLINYSVGKMLFLLLTFLSATSSSYSLDNPKVAPLADITPAGPVTFCHGSGTLTVNNPPGAATFQWQVGGVNISGATNSTLNVTASGTYTCIVTTGGNSTTLNSVVVTVQSISITASSTSVCNGTSTTLTASGSTTGSYTWINPSGSTGATVTVTPTSPSAQYSVWSDINSCRDTAYIAINVKPNPVASFTYSPNNGCPRRKRKIYFNSTSQQNGAGNLTYLWNFGDPNSGSNNTSNDNNPDHSFVGSGFGTGGTFTVTLTVTGANGCSNTISQQITIGSFPDATLIDPDISHSTPFTLCGSNNSYTYDIVVSNATTTSLINTQYQINWGDNTSWTGTTFTSDLTHTYPSLGYFTLQYIVSAGGCKDSSEYQVYIGSNPAITFGTTGATLQQCLPARDTFLIGGVSNNPPGTTYTVFFNDGTDSLTFNHPPPSYFVHTFLNSSCGATGGTKPNTYFVKIIAENPCGYTEAQVAPITTVEPPNARFTISPDSVACVNSTLTFTNTSIGGSVVVQSGSGSNATFYCDSAKSVFWSISAITGTNNAWSLTSGSYGTTYSSPGTQSIGVSFSQPGTYRIKMFIRNNAGTSPLCRIDSTSRIVCIQSPPNPSFSISPQNGCAPVIVNTTNSSTNLPVCGTANTTWTVIKNSSICTPVSATDYQFITGTTASSTAPIIQFNNEGNYSVSLTMQSVCGTYTTPTQTVIVKTKPQAIISPIASICSGQAVTPVANILSCGGTISSYTWTFPGGTPSTSALSNPGPVIFSSSGTANIALSVTNECGTTSPTQTVTINPTPTVNAVSGITRCAGQTSGAINFSGSQTGATYNWTNSNAAIGLASSGSGNIPSFTVANNSGAPITATITVTPTLSGCTGTSITFTITVNPNPSVSVNNANLCSGSPVTLTASGADTYSWSPSSGLSATTGATVTANPSTTTAYTVTGTTSATGCTNQATATVTVVTPPTISGTPSGPSTCATSTGNIIISGLSPSTTYTLNYSYNGAPHAPVTFNTGATGTTYTILNLASGVYSGITVTVSGCLSNTLSFSLSDPNPPASPVIASIVPICSGGTLSLSASGAPPGSVYTWSGPNGFSSTQQNPVINNISTAYTGTFSVTATLSGCTSSATSVTATIQETPATPTASSNSPVCSGNTLSLSANTTSTMPVTWSWTGPNSFSSTQQNPTINSTTISMAGQYTVIATAAYSGGLSCPSAPRNINVTVKTTPVITSSFSSNPSNCSSSTGSITLSGMNSNTSYQVFYTGPSGTATSLNLTTNINGVLTISNLPSGTYTNVYVVLNGCPSAVVGPFTLADPSPPATPTAASVNPLCSGNTLSLSASSSLTGTWHWTGPNNFSSNQQNPNITNATTAATGTYSVTITVNGCTSLPGTVNVVVEQTPATPVATSNSPVCSGNPLTLTANTTSTMPVAWSWTGPNSFVSNLQNPTVSNTATASMSGQYVVTATATYSATLSCPSAPANVTAVVNPTPVITGSSSTNPTNCATSTGSIILNGLNPNVSYSVVYTGPSGTITVPAITSTATGNVIIASLPSGVYSNVYVVLTNCPSSQVGPFNLVDPNPPPTPVIQAISPICDGEQLSLSASTTATGTATWSWTGPNGFTSNLSAPVINPASTAASGTYSVTVTINSCTSPAQTINAIVNPRPLAPVVTSPIVYCQYQTPVALTATALSGHILQWYTAATGGTASNTAPVPSTNTTGTTSYYVSQVTSQNCEGPRAQIDVVVNPTPVIGTQNQTICSGASFSITPTGTGVNATTVYNWSAPVVTGGLTGGVSGSNATLISGTLSNPTDFVQTATYIVTPVTGTCTGNTFTVVITVNPAPHATFNPGNQTICSGDQSQAVTITSPTPGVNIPWISNPPAGINGAQTSGNNSIPVQTLINTTASPIIVTYAAVAITSGASGCPGDTSRYYITVNPKPLIANQSYSICSHETFTLAPANNPPATIVPTGTTFTWTFVDNPNILGESAQITGVDTIRQTLINITNIPQSVVYTITPTSGVAGNCVGSSFQVTVTVNPVPEIPALFDTICSGNSFSFTPVNGLPNAATIVPAGTTYNWSVPVMPAGVAGAVSGNAQASISGSLTNTTFAPITITYVVTPVSGVAGNCPGVPFNVNVTINPRASINNNPLSQSVCNGLTTTPVNWTSYTAGASYSWTVVSSGSVTGFLPAGSGNTLGAMTLTNTGIAQDSVVYAVSSTASACSGPPTNFTIYVNPDARAAFTFPKDTACWPFSIVINNTSPRSPGNVNIPNGSYDWYTLSPSGASTYLGAATNFPGYTIIGPSDSIIIKMVAISYFGCKNDSVSHEFFTRPKPSALFTMSNRDSCGPLTVSFTNQTAIIDTFRYIWNFGNGQTSTLAQPNPVTFLTNPNHFDTTYIITLKAYNECDTSTYVDSVIIRANPKARFFVSSTSGCSPFTLVVSNTSLGHPTIYYWDFDDGFRDTTTNMSNITHTYYTGIVDTFHVMLIAQSDCGRDTQIINIRVAPNIIRPGVTINATDLYGCVAHTVNFINNTGGATAFTWDFGDNTPLASTTIFQNIVQHTYTTAGTFTVHVAMTNGCSDTAIDKQVIVYPKPQASFVTNQTTYCLGDTIRVTNTSQQANSYLWNWGVGASVAGFQPTNVYTAPGTYTITLFAQVSAPTGVVCSDTVSHPVVVLNKPDSTLITNISSANCAPFNFSASTPGIINETVTWYIYDTTVAGYPIIQTGPAVLYTFNHPGTYTIHMVAENLAGCKDSATRTFTVYQKPVAGFTPLNLSTCSMDTIVGYVNTSYANNYTPLTYKWYVDGVQRATTGNFSYRYITSAATPLPYTYVTKLVATNIVGCADSINGLLQINPTAKSSFVINNPNACIPFVASITDNSAYATNYSWYVNGVFISNSPTPVLNFTSPNTNYTVTLIVSNIYACKPDTSSFSFRTRIMPKALFSLNNTLSCTGQLSLITTNNSQNANAYAWEWGDGTPNSTLSNPTHLYTSVGTYQIMLTASDGQCTDTTSKIVVVAQKPNVNFAANVIKACDTASVHMVNMTTNANSYLWVVSNGMTSTQSSPTFILPPSSIPYTVQLIAYNQQGCRDSLTKANYVKVDPRPVADFHINPSATISIPDYTFSFTNLTINNVVYNYLWSLGDGSYANTRDVPDHLYPDTGSYPVQLIVTDTTTGCKDTIVKIARIEGYPGYLYVPNAFYPNSIRTEFKSFKPLGKGLAEYELQIFDSWGKLVFRSTQLDAAGIPVEGWDGTFKGKEMQQDSYAWYIRAKFRNGRVWDGMHYNQRESGSQGHTFGTVTLFR